MSTWIGLDLGGTKLGGVAVDDAGHVHARFRRATEKEDGPEAVFERCVAAVRDLERKAGPAEGVGLGFPGLIDPRAGCVRSSVILPGFEGWPLAERLAQAVGRPVALDNDATLAGLGEFVALGEPPGLTLLVLTVGTGIGGAVFIDGKLHRGADGTAGEFGHVTLDWNGEPCACGQRGCVNLIASGTGIARRAAQLAVVDPRSRLSRTPSLPDVARAAAAGDAVARQAIDEGARALGTAIAGAINLFDPDRISLCGGVTMLGEPWLRAVREEAQRRAFREPAARCVLGLALHGEESGALGAARLALQQTGERTA
jgi:glucokinase